MTPATASGQSTGVRICRTLPNPQINATARTTSTATASEVTANQMRRACLGVGGGRLIKRRWDLGEAAELRDATVDARGGGSFSPAQVSAIFPLPPGRR